MKLAKILAPFGLSAVLFVLAYLSGKEGSSELFSIMGIILAIVGIVAIFSTKANNSASTTKFAQSLNRASKE